MTNKPVDLDEMPGDDNITETVNFQLVCQSITWIEIDRVNRGNRRLRRRSDQSLRKLVRSIQHTSFFVPPVLDNKLRVLDGDGRIDAAIEIGINKIPVIIVDHLPPADLEALSLVLNRAQEDGKFNEEVVQDKISFILDECPDYDLEFTGFELGEIETHLSAIEDHSDSEEPDPADAVPTAMLEEGYVPTSRAGDLFLVKGKQFEHRVYCGDACSPEALSAAVGGKVPAMVLALIVKSANDVAVVVAENIAGSEWKFAQLMTWKARKLGMNKTRFLNASGLPNRKQVTTARDMIKLSQAIQKDFPGLYRYFATKTFAYKGRVYKNYNRLMGRMKGIDGIKTGYTRASGFNLTSSYWQGRKHVVAVVMGGKTARRRDAFMAKILRKSVRKASRGQRKKHIVFTRKRPAQKQLVKSKPIKEPIQLAEGPKVKPKPQRLGADIPPAGPYHIQIGAFGSEADAKQRLASIGSKAGNLLTGHKSFTMLVPNNTVYRARFAGFTEQDARQTCRKLKRKAIDCLAVPAP